jgi:hypothetical protein
MFQAILIEKFDGRRLKSLASASTATTTTPETSNTK